MEVILQDGTRFVCESTPFAVSSGRDLFWAQDRAYVVLLLRTASVFPDEPWLNAMLHEFNVTGGENGSYWQRLIGWPVAVVIEPRLGLVFPRPPSGLSDVGKLISPEWLALHPELNANLRIRVEICANLARAVGRLHSLGICHSDLSPITVLANPIDGSAYLLGCESVVLPLPDAVSFQVIRSQQYMAPEWITEEWKFTTLADLHALSVLIYQILMSRHPLIGPKIHSSDPEEDERLSFGSEALFIEHPTDRSNRPKRMLLTSENLGPEIWRLMKRAFIEGLHRPVERPTAMEWERALVHLSGILVRCANPQCILGWFPLPDNALLAVGEQANSGTVCPWCQTPVGRSQS